jgi:hypothetical protein
MRTGFLVAALLAMPAFGHRLDEYLQGVLLSVEKNRVHAEMSLTPGVAILPMVLDDIDRDRDGAVSEAEARAYGERVLRDLTVTADRHRVVLQLGNVRFPSAEELRQGRGEIQLEISGVPPGSGTRNIVFENHHWRSIAAYQVNCLAPRDSDIRIVAQNRDYIQSHYEVEYVQVGAGSGVLPVWTLAAFAPLVAVRFAIARRRANVL